MVAIPIDLSSTPEPLLFFSPKDDALTALLVTALYMMLLGWGIRSPAAILFAVKGLGSARIAGLP